MRAVFEFARRLLGLVRRPRTDVDLEEELRLHVELMAEEERRRGHQPAAAARAARIRAGGVTQAMDVLRDQRSIPSLDALAADLVFGWRQIVRHRAASAAAVLSLGLAMGATMAAFRLVDAVLLRPLPVADPSRLFVVTTTSHDPDGQPADRDDFDYPTYREYVAAAGGEASVILIGSAVRRPILIGGGEPEAAIQQFVSGNVFSTLGLQPVLGRLLGANDDRVPGGHPVAVISHDFWQRRFAGDRDIVGRTFRVRSDVIEIVGVGPEGFTGTEPGAVTDFFLPSMMNAQALNSPGWSWFRIWIRPNARVAPDEVQARLQSRTDSDLGAQLQLRPAGAGVSAIQKSFRRPLLIVAALAALLLLIACANVANLLLARAMSRSTEMALRMSIGASRGRVIQLMLIESMLLALLSCAVGALFAWPAAPFVVSMLAPAERPVRVILDLDWRTLVAGTGLTLAVTMLFGLAPALRASAIAPIGALKQTRARRGQRGLTGTLVAAQMAFCVFLLFGASLFVGTLERLQTRPLGFVPENLVHIGAESRAKQPPAVWAQLAAALRGIPRVESAAAAGWAPLSGNRWRASVTVAGRPSPSDAPHWVAVSPGYFETMRTPLIEGREFRAGDTPPGRSASGPPVPGVAIVNETFARVYFDGRSPVGHRVIVNDSSAPMEVVGVAADAVYYSVREGSHAAVFVPFEPRSDATLLVRTTDGLAELRESLRREVTRLRPDFQLRDVAPFEAFVAQQMIRERLLAALSTFFAVLALLLAVTGIYGVLNYAVARERREIGLRMALGAGPGHVLTLIAAWLLGVVCLGAFAGLAGGLAFGRMVQTLLFEMEPTDPLTLMAPILALAGAAALAALPPAIRAVRVDPAQAIRSEG